MCTIGIQCPPSPEEGVRNPGIGITKGDESPVVSTSELAL